MELEMFSPKKECRCCFSTDLKEYIDLGDQPLANSYHKGEVQPTFPLTVNVCQRCYHSQLSVVVDPDYMFKNYLYVSGTTETLNKHFDEFASDALSRVNPVDPKVLDIACNDGTLLQKFKNRDAHVWGIDPAENLRHLTEEKNIPVVVDYWRDAVLDQFPKFDIITATNVFAHVDDPFAFLQTCTYALERKGVIIIEFPYGQKLIRNNEFDTIYHEHLSYFLVNSMLNLCDRVGLTIADILETPIHGGSIRFFITHPMRHESKKIEKYLEAEEHQGLLDIDAYDVFTQQVEKIKAELLKREKLLSKKGKYLVGYGASAKGNTMLNYTKLPLMYIVDDNPLKHGYMTPGMNIPINPVSYLNHEKDLNLIVLSWNFLREIREKVKTMRGPKNTSLFNYIPYVREERI